MAGSRKGEHRGAANPNRTKPARPGSPMAAARKAAKPRKLKTPPFDDPVLKSIVKSRLGPAKVERQLEIYKMVSGSDVTVPKDAMLEVLSYFRETTHDYHKVMLANMERADTAPTAQAREVYEMAAAAAEQKVKEYAMLTLDAGARAAPFCHPRLAAVVDATRNQGQNPWNILGLLLRDIDEAGKPARYIDHDPNEGNS